MKKVFTLILAVAALMGVHAGTASAGVIFSENFDSQPDWWPTALECGYNNTGYTGEGASVGSPQNWTYWRNDELWNPYASKGATPGSKPTIQISSLNHYGDIGKAFTVFNESNAGRSGDGWGADGMIAKKFDQDYKNIYASVKIKFQPGFKWHWTPDMAGVLKIFRFYHYDGGAVSPFKFFKDGASAPIYIFDVSNKEQPYGFRAAHSFRCDPQATNYACSPSYDIASNFSSNNFASTLGNGNWHTIGWQARINSSPGVADGIFRFWVDGKLMYERTDMKWIGPGGSSTAGWNMVALGGNAYNQYAPASSKAEQWYALDNLVVSTEMIPL